MIAIHAPTTANIIDAVVRRASKSGDCWANGINRPYQNPTPSTPIRQTITNDFTIFRNITPHEFDEVALPYPQLKPITAIPHSRLRYYPIQRLVQQMLLKYYSSTNEPYRHPPET